MLVLSNEKSKYYWWCMVLIKFVSDLRQVGGFLRVLRFPPPINQIYLFIVLNVTFSNISAISWRPVLVVEEAGVPEENHRPWASNW
jgi:hypothetical protein